MLLAQLPGDFGLAVPLSGRANSSPKLSPMELKVSIWWLIVRKETLKARGLGKGGRKEEKDG